MPLGSSLLNYTTGGRRQLWDLVLEGGAEISSAQAKFGSTSLIVDGSSTTAIALLGVVGLAGYVGGAPRWPGFTVEFQFRPNRRPNSTIILWDVIGVTTGWEMLFSAAGVISQRTQDFSVSPSVTRSIASSALTNDVWYHVACVRSVDTWGMWIDGVSQGTFTNTDFRESGSRRQFLSTSTIATPAIYFMDELRISTVARYDPGTNFTPPAAAFDNDLDTICLYHFEGTNGATTTQDDNT